MLFSIAWRNIWRNRTRSWAIILSVAIGIWAGAMIASLYYGMGESRLETAIGHELSHLQVHHPQFSEDLDPQYGMDSATLCKVLAQTPGLKAFSLRTLAQGMIANAAGSNGVQINGIDPGEEEATRSFSTFLREGNYFDGSKKNQILVGKKLADKMKLRLNAKVVLTFQDVEMNLVAGAFRVVGIYQSENSPLDERNVYVLRNDLSILLRNSGHFHEAAVLLTDGEALPGAAYFLKKNLPQWKVENWQQISPETALLISSLDTTTLITVGIILLALAFGIVNTMLMSVLERTREIGMLMAVGMNKLRLFTMVVLETMLLTLVGCPIGFLVAWGMVAWLSVRGIDISSFAGSAMSNFGYSSMIYPLLPANTVMQIIGIAVITALLSSVLPAWQALRLKPVEAIAK